MALQAEKSPVVLLLYLACLRSGAVFLPLNTAYSDAEVAYARFPKGKPGEFREDWLP